ncbi:outer membrane beta-barrel protein [Arsukibacterium ikkense]|nr:outer membrane beta-barrel protein [Arsukibacterium ikkense]
MLFKKIALVAAVFSCTAVQANTAPSYRYLQGSIEHISQSGDESFSDTGFGAAGAWQFNNNWFIATEWQRFTDSESYTESFNNERVDMSLKLTLDRYYFGTGYVMPISDITNISFAGYIGSYRVGVRSSFQAFINNQLSFSDSYSDSSSNESVKVETVVRSNINNNVELTGRAYYEYLNANLDDKSQYGLGAGAQYNFTPNFALRADLSYGRLLDENTTQFSLGARYHF